MQRYVQPIPAEKACTTVVLVIPTIVSPDPDPIISVSLFLYLLSQAKALEGIDVASFMQTVSSILRQVSVEALLHGNVTLSDAKDTEQVLEHVMTSPTSSVLPGEKFPKETLIQLPLSSAESHTIVAPTKDATESNTAVEVYFQVRLLQNSCLCLV